ncbi:hypothetical protein BCE75_10365 [Isoptericola sp. CG 20/1183]|uniref:Integral membrane protein n=1 Tax=Isoptericola halotolerans TaxID=300560 RepID=A0ABX5EI10_9MICO|nr:MULTISPECIES: hypothetical protein [Isoptericola]PRZ08141.1 hypothetical protein BCL65_10366 [Isoptericola halotolerans]PRZ08938.1 hypothetical protein BCE75_10365 [Isoptericola sp. CG 20/1183]
MTSAETVPLRSRGDAVRRWVAAVLVVVTTLLVVASSVAVWAHRTVFDTDDFMDTVGPVLDDPAFYDALADNVTEQTLLALDLDTRVSARLTELDEVLALALVERLEVEPGPLLEALGTRVDRPTLAALTPVVVDRLEERVEKVVDRLVTSEAFRERLPRLVERAHTGAIALARADVEDHPNVYLTDDAVMLDTTPLIAEALREALGSVGDMLPGVTLPDAVTENAPQARAQLGEALGARLPDDFGQVALLDRETFDMVQGTVRTVDRVVWALVVVTVLLIVATVLVAPDRRRGAIQLAIGVAAGLVIAAALVAQLRGLVVEAARTPDGERVAGVLFDAVSGGLHEILWLIGIIAVVAAVVALLLGRPAWLGRAADRWPWVGTVSGQDGRLPRRVAEHADALRFVAVGLSVLVVVVTGFSWVALVLVSLALVGSLVGISVAQRIADVPGGRRSTPTPTP